MEEKSEVKAEATIIDPKVMGWTDVANYPGSRFQWQGGLLWGSPKAVSGDPF
jgi:hypothetical protein